ncbi:MAG: hypothetical protein WB036_23495, partial [Pseudolabrys sp.]
FDEITELVASAFPMRLRRLSVYGPIDIGRGARFNSQFHEFQHSFCGDSIDHCNNLRLFPAYALTQAG